MRRWPNVGLLLAHRLRRWPNSKPTLGQRLTLAGYEPWQLMMKTRHITVVVSSVDPLSNFEDVKYFLLSIPFFKHLHGLDYLCRIEALSMFPLPGRTLTTVVFWQRNGRNMQKLVKCSGNTSCLTLRLTWTGMRHQVHPPKVSMHH